MSALGHKRTCICAVAMYASRQQTDILNSLLGAMSFPVCNKKFPVLIAGNSTKEVSCFNGFWAGGEGLSKEIPCIFPGIRELGSRDTFAAASQHSHLVVRF